MSDKKTLLSLLDKFFEHDIQTATYSLEALEAKEAAGILKDLPNTLRNQTFHFMEPHQAAEILMEFPEETAKEIVENLPLKSATEIFLGLSQAQREKFLTRLKAETQKRLVAHSAYPEGSAGRIMNPDFLAFHAGMKVREAIGRIRTLHKKAPINYVYALDEENRLAGVLNMRDLLLASPDEPVESAMTKEVFAVHVLMDREEVALLASRKRFLSVPVVDEERHILGTIKTDELIGYTQQEATEDIQKMFGAGGNERVFSPIGFSIRKRLPWLYINLATAFLAAAVVGLFEDIISQLTILAVFLPVVAGQGGNAGAQTLAVVIRGLALREVTLSHAKKVIVKEGLIGLSNGLAIGIVTALAAWFWKENPFLGIVIGCAMTVNLVAAGVAGAAIPLLMKRLGFDPAQSSAIFQTTVTDVVGFAAFLGFAVILQHLIL